MGQSKRNCLAAAQQSITPPDELREHQFVARVAKAEGNNLYTCSLPHAKTIVVELAPRFRNTIWIKRGGFVVIDTTPSEERGKTSGRVQGEIINVVRDEKAWRKMPYWYGTYGGQPSVLYDLQLLSGAALCPMSWGDRFRQYSSILTHSLSDRPSEFPKITYPEDEDEHQRAFPPTDSEDEA